MIPKRDRRRIVVDDQLFHWHFPSGRRVDHRKHFQLIIQAADTNGSVLVIRQATWSDVTPVFVRKVIEEAIKLGWSPLSDGAPFVFSPELPPDNVLSESGFDT